MRFLSSIYQIEIPQIASLKSNHNDKRLSVFLLILLPTIAILWPGGKTSYGSEFILWDRLKIEPEFALVTNYDDNIYQTSEDNTSDWITSFYPSIDTQIAFTPQSRIGLFYSGRYDDFQDAGNFRNDHHYAGAYLKLDSRKGTLWELGAWKEESAKQPFSVSDRSKDFTISAIYTDLNLSISEITQLYGHYHHSARRFENNSDRRDDYDRDSLALGVAYSRSHLFPLLLEYRYENQENDRPGFIPTQFVYHAAYTGFKWNPKGRLSGAFRLGYLRSTFNDADAYDGWAADTELTYSLSPFTRITGKIYRSVRETTRSDRDTLDYYIFAGSGLSVNYSRLDPIRFNLYSGYENRDYRSLNVSTDKREDDFLIAGLTVQWRVQTWLSIALGYRYRENDSTIDDLSYQENRLFVQLRLFPRENSLRRRRIQTVEQVDFF
jgi:hypothetical protein